MLLSIGIIGVTILLFSNVMKFQNDPYFSEIKKGDTKDLLYSLPISLFFIVFFKSNEDSGLDSSFYL